MINTIYKLFGIKVLETEYYPSEEEPKKMFEGKPQGELLEFSPKERARVERQKLEEQL